MACGSSELVDLHWDQIDFGRATLAVRRVKQGTPAASDPRGRTAGAAPAATRTRPGSPFVFTSERGAPFSTAGFAKLVARAGVQAKLSFAAHPHMLRHACGFALANKGHDTRACRRTWASKYSTYGALFGISARSVQGFLAGLIRHPG